jgi:hypothetical protein
VTEAINSPPGHVAEAILADSRLTGVRTAIDPSADWLMQLARLLTLEGDPRRYAIAIVSGQLPWLHHIAHDWTDRHLLSVLDADDEEDRDSFWDGFLWNPKAGPELYLRLKPGLVALVKEKRSPREGHLQSLACFVLSGWITPGGAREKRLVSNDAFRQMLLKGGDDFRSHVVWQFRQEFRGNNESRKQDWPRWAVEFMKEVWPHQRSVKNPTMSARLCELLISDSVAFQELADVVLPFLTKITRDVGLHFHLHGESSGIIKECPKPLLAVLYTILPEHVSDWPYGIWEILEKIVAADSGLLSDERFRELQRRWNAS